MRSSSRLPWLSNRQSSTFVALAENSAKLVPRPSHVAPRGCGVPAESRMLLLWDEKNCSKRRNGKTDLGDGAFVQRLYCSGVPHIAAAVNRSVGVEHFAPFAGKGHADAIVAIDLRREIDHDQAARARVLSLAQPGEDTAVGVVHHQPFEAGMIAV